MSPSDVFSRLVGRDLVFLPSQDGTSRSLKEEKYLVLARHVQSQEHPEHTGCTVQFPEGKQGCVTSV